MPPVPGLESFSWDLPPSESRVRGLSLACSKSDGCRNLDDALLAAALDGKAWAWWDPLGDCYLAASRRGRLEILVHPRLRGRGIGSRLLALGIDRIRRHAALKVDIWAYGDRARTVGWLERQGFKSQRILYRLERPWSEVIPPKWPPGWSLGIFRPQDANAWHSLHCRLQSDPASAWTMEALGRQLADPTTPPSQFHLLWQGDTLRGYFWLKGAEIFLFALDPEVRGHGLGAKLLAWALHYLQREAFVYCDDRRPAALALYKKFNFQESGRDRCLQLSLKS